MSIEQMPDIPEGCRKCPYVTDELISYKRAYRFLQTERIARDALSTTQSKELADSALTRAYGKLQRTYEELDSARARTIGCEGLAASGIKEPSAADCQSPLNFAP